MEKKYTITKKQLVFLEDYLRKKRRFSEEEEFYELMDHIICGFEESGNENLTQYLANNLWFISQYGTDRRQKTNRVYQKLLLKKFLSLFTSLRILPITILVVFILFKVAHILDGKPLVIVFAITLMVHISYGLLLTYHKKSKIRKLVPFQCLVSLLSPPLLFLCFLTLLESFSIENRDAFFVYWVFAFGISSASILVIKEQREIVLNKYKHLLY